MADAPVPPEEQNNSFREEIVHAEQLLVNSRTECYDIGTKFQDLTMKMAHILKHQSDDTDQDDYLTNELVERQKELRSHLQEELSKYKNRISNYQVAQREQSKVIDDLHNRVEEYRARCARLEAALADYPLQDTLKDVPDYSIQNGSSMDLDTTLIRLEQEQSRCQALNHVNSLLREQLENATEANRLLTTDIHKLTEEWQHTREELDIKESEWKDEEQSFTDYFTKEHHRLLSLWRHVLDFRHEFTRIKSSTERDISTMRSQMTHTTQNITGACLQLLMATPLQQMGDNSIREVEKQHQEYFSMKIKYESEKAELNEKIRDLASAIEKKQMMLDEKDKINESLKKKNLTMENIMKSKKDASATESVDTVSQSEETSRYCQAVKDIVDIVLEDSEHQTWIGTGTRSLSPVRNVLLTAKPISDKSIGDKKFLESITKAIQSALHKRCLQVEELNLKLASNKERIKTQQKLIASLEEDKQSLHRLTSQLSTQLEALQMNMEEFMKDKNQIKSALDESDTHKSFLEHLRKSLNDQIESLNAENDRLHQLQKNLHEKVEQLEDQKDKLRVSERNLSQELSKSSRKTSLLEQHLETVKKEFQNSQEQLQQVTLDKDMLQQEKQEFTKSLTTLERQRSDLDLHVNRLKSEEITLKNSLLSLQNLNESLSQDKQDLCKSLSDISMESETTKFSFSKRKIEIEKEKQEMKENLEKLQQKCRDLETERDLIKDSLQAAESAKSDMEQEKSETQQRNNDLLNQVTKLSSQKKSLEEELEHTRKEINRQLENTEKSSQEKVNLARVKAELAVKAEAAEKELLQLTQVAAALREEKEKLEKDLYSSQQLCSSLQEEKDELERELDNEKSRIEFLQDQVADFKNRKDFDADAAARQKDTLNQIMQQLEQEYQITLQNQKHQHKHDIDILNQEKESQRVRLETTQEDLSKRLQEEQDKLISNHVEELSAVKRQLLLLEREMEEKLFHAHTEKKRLEKEYQDENHALELTIQQLQKEIADSEIKTVDAEKKITLSDGHYQLVIEELQKEGLQLKEEIKNNILNHESALEQLNDRIIDLKYEKDAALETVIRLKSDFNASEEEKNRLSKEIEDLSINIEDDKKHKEQLEDQITHLQHQLSTEKDQTVIVKKSKEEFKNRLHKAQMESTDLRKSLQEAKHRLEAIENSNNREKEDNSELRNTLHEVEKSRLEGKREMQGLRRRIVTLESALDAKDREIIEMHIIMGRGEEAEAELKNEIVQLKQKAMESDASREASFKELNNLRRKLLDVDHKFKLQQEEHHAILQDSLAEERSLTEHRANLERSFADATEEMHDLRLKLNFSEGKIAALEAQMVKIEGAKRDAESKLNAIHLSLRSTLGLGSDSGFHNSSTHLLLSPWSSRRGSPSKLEDTSVSSVRESTPLKDRRSMSRSPHRQATVSWSVMDLDVELIRSALQDLVQKSYNTEKERDDLKSDVMKFQRQLEETKEQHNDNLLKLQSLQREMDITSKDKNDLESQLASCKAILLRNEESIQNLEREKRRLTEKNTTLEQTLSSFDGDKNEMHEKISELKKNELKLEQEKQTMTEAQEQADAKTAKAELNIRTLETEKVQMQAAMADKDTEIEILQDKVEELRKSLQSTTTKTSSLQLTVEHLNRFVQKHRDNGNQFEDKIDNLKKSLSDSTLLVHKLNDDISKIKREHSVCEQEKSSLQRSVETLRTTVNEFKYQNRNLNEQIQTLTRDLRSNELKQAELEGQVQGYQNMISHGEESEQDSNLRIHQLQQDKALLEQQLSNLKDGLIKTEEFRIQLEKHLRKVEKEKFSLQKALDKVEHERQKTEEVASRSVLERSTLGKSLSAMEIENRELLRKVQTLQAQLAELEQRHLERIKELDRKQNIDAQLEIDRLRTAQRQMEQLFEVRERTHRQKVHDLEERLSGMNDQFVHRLNEFQQQQIRTSESTSFHHVLGDSLRTVNQDTSKLSSEAKKIHHFLEHQLSQKSSPGTPASRISRSVSPSRKGTSSQVKKRLDKSFHS